ncbi:hypothetical protein LguiA_029246 [Lonicera macranthoides]
MVVVEEVYERSRSNTQNGPSMPALLNFVSAEMIPSGYLIRPCEGGGSIIHIVDHMNLEAWSVPEVLRPFSMPVEASRSGESNFSLQNPHSHSSPQHHLRRSTSQLHRPTTTGPSFTDFSLPRHHILLSLSRAANQPPSHGLCLLSSHHKVTKDAAQQTSKVIGGATPIASSTVETITSADPAVLAGSGGALFLAYLLPPHVWSNISFSLRGYKGELTPAQMLDLMCTKNHIMIDIRLEKDKEKAGIPRLPPGARSKLIATPLEELPSKLKSLVRNVKKVEAEMAATFLSSSLNYIYIFNR